MAPRSDSRPGWHRALAPLGLALLTALWAWAVFSARPLPSPVARLAGLDSDASAAMRGGMQLRYVLPVGVDAAATARALAARPGVRARLDGDALIVELGGVPSAEVMATAQALTAPLGLHVVRSDHPFMRELYARVMAGDADAAAEGVTVDEDTWRPDRGPPRRDVYLTAPTADALRAYLLAARVTPPAGLAIFIEELEARYDQPAAARTYLVDAAPALGGERVAGAEVVADPITYRPMVAVTLDGVGAAQFGDLTAAHVGDKLATALGDRVISAPVINEAIRGGRLSIFLGGGDAQRLERDATRLVHVLQAGPLPRGGVVEEVTWIGAASGATTRRALVRGALALALGALAAALLLVARRLGLRHHHPALPLASSGEPAGASAGASPLGRALLTALLPLGVLWLGGKIALPGVNAEEIRGLAMVGADLDQLPPALTVFTIGVLPLLTAALLVEAVVFVVPPWRRQRHAGPVARRRIGVAVAIVGVVLAALQAYLISQWLHALAPDVRWTASTTAMVIATVVAGVLVLAVVAELVSAHGLGNGYATLTLSGTLLALWQGGVPSAHAGTAAALLGIVLAVVIAVGLLGGRVAGAAVPNAGTEPLSWAPGALLIIPLLALLQVSLPAGAAPLLAPGTHALGVVIVAIGLAAAFSWRAGDGRRFARATAVSVLALLALFVVSTTTAQVGAGAGLLAAAFAVPMAAAAAAYALDLVGEWRARRRGLAVCCWPLHRTARADDVAAALAAAGISAHLRSRHQRQLTQAMAPWLPIEVMVAPADAARAQQIAAEATR